MNAPATQNETSQANARVLPRKRHCSSNKAWFQPGVAQRQTHGMANSATYRVWSGILSRCKTASASGYANYGGRGIGVCERWLSFENFISDMGEKPDGMSIDRINSDDDYSPDNCRWASRKEQNRNQRDLLYLTLNGKTQCASAWSEELGINAGTIRSRIRYGWSDDRILTTPSRAHKVYRNAAK